MNVSSWKNQQLLWLVLYLARVMKLLLKIENTHASYGSHAPPGGTFVHKIL